MRFLSLIRLDENAGVQPSAQLMSDMGRLIDDMRADGSLVETQGLRPTAEGRRLRLSRGRLAATDGPFTESKEIVGGYIVFEAESLDAAMTLVERFLRLHGPEWEIECEVRAIDPACGADT